jgi:hypothetical protein
MFAHSPLPRAAGRRHLGSLSSSDGKLHLEKTAVSRGYNTRYRALRPGVRPPALEGLSVAYFVLFLSQCSLGQPRLQKTVDGIKRFSTVKISVYEI